MSNTIEALDKTIDSLYDTLAQQEANLKRNPNCKGTKKAVEAVKKAIRKVEEAKVKAQKALEKAGINA